MLVVEAVYYDGTKESRNQLLAWIHSRQGVAQRSSDRVNILLAEQVVVVPPEHYVVSAVLGSFEVFDPDLFNAIFAPVDDEGEINE